MDSNNRQNKKVEILISENHQKELLNIAKARKINVNTTIEAVTQIVMAIIISLIVLSCWGTMLYGLIVKNYPVSITLAVLNAIAVLIAFLQKRK
jgi:CHASE2 domain-containing sensor protein